MSSITRLSEHELQTKPKFQNSWHYQYRSSAYIYVGNFESELTEGDLIVAMSQFGEVVDIEMGRNRETGKSMGYCFLAYADQRSTVLAVDNMNGAVLYKRVLKVDHVADYKGKSRDGVATGAEGGGLGVKETKVDHVGLKEERRVSFREPQAEDRQREEEEVRVERKPEGVKDISGKVWDFV